MPTPTRAEEALAAVLAGVPRPSEENGDLRILDSWTVGEDTICVAYQGWWEDGSIGLRRRIGDDLPVSWVVGQILDAELGEAPGGMIEQDQRAAHIQDSPSLFGKAQLSTKDNAATVLSHLRGIGGTRPGVLRPGNLLIHGPLDMVFSPRCLRGPPARAPQRCPRPSALGRGPQRGWLHCLYFDQHPVIILDRLTKRLRQDKTLFRTRRGPLARVDAGQLGEAVSPGLGTGNALVVTLLVQLGVVAVTGLLNLRLRQLVG
ncbi:hypothetical protein [Streptomyces sp. NPDC088816]|uniref:hypothetical protein n=1 Tax=Streptomyces sp. NPDC088816 TaxID=3365906 RepID=UPI003813A294